MLNVHGFDIISYIRKLTFDYYKNQVVFLNNFPPPYIELLTDWWLTGLCNISLLRYKGLKNTKNAKKCTGFKQIAYFKSSPRPIQKLKMCVNVIYEVLAILAIGLVNISFVGRSSLEIQWPEIAT